MSDTWEPPAGFDALASLINGLAAQGRGEVYNEDEMTYASMLLACSALVSRGLDVDWVLDTVESLMQRGAIHITWSAADGLMVSIGEDVEGGLEVEMVDG